MSATFRAEDRDMCTQLLRVTTPNIMCGDLSRRNTSLECYVTGSAFASLQKQLKTQLKANPSAQHLIYTNSATNAEGTLLDATERILRWNRLTNNGPRTIAHSFTGNDGIKAKTITMDAFANYGDIDEEPEFDDAYDYGAARYHKIQIVNATSAANAGINSKWLMDVDQKGLVASMYDYLQAAGRPDRLQKGEPGSSSYGVHISFSSYVSLYLIPSRDFILVPTGSSYGRSFLSAYAVPVKVTSDFPFCGFL